MRNHVRLARFVRLAIAAGSLMAPLAPRGVTAQTTLLDQPPHSGAVLAVPPLPSRVADAGCSSPSPVVHTIADDFVVPTAIDVEIASWMGNYARSAAASDPTPFTLVFHRDAAGLPGTTIATVAVLPAQTLLFSGTDPEGHPVSTYSFRATFPGVHLDPGAYWLELYETDGSAPECFEWTTGNPDAAHGRDGEAFATAAPGVAWTANLRSDPLDNRVLTLEGGLNPGVVAVPALAGWGLLALEVSLGVAALVALRR